MDKWIVGIIAVGVIIYSVVSLIRDLRVPVEPGKK
jgi:hypothetical protein